MLSMSVVCRPVSVLVAGLLSTMTAHAALVGHWTFEGSHPTLDLTGNFAELQLQGTASISNGALNLSGSGMTATGWAQATMTAALPSLDSKTLVVWATMTGLDDVARAGALMSVDARTYDQFDGIVFAERQRNQWMNGSSFWSRTSDSFSGQESATGQPVMLAISYEVQAGQVRVEGYRDGLSMGSYFSSHPAVWSSNDLEVLFGPRHTQNGQVFGAISAQVHEARLYGSALTASEIGGLQMVSAQVTSPVPEASSIAMAVAGLLVAGMAARRRVQ